MKIDLHTHTFYSDGFYRPLELVKKAKEAKIDILSITDHNNINGVKELLSNKDFIPKDMKLITGVELTARKPRGHMHILGYNINPNSKVMSEILSEYKTQHIYYTMELLTLLKNSEYYSVTFKDKDIINLLNSKRNPGRNTLAELLEDYNYESNFPDAINYLNHLKQQMTKQSSKHKGLNSADCIEAIKKSGGIPVLAHPITLNSNNDTELDAEVKRLVKYGLEGIEIYTPKHKKRDREKYLLLAEKYNLLVSGGSDYHNTTLKEETLGNLGTRSLPTKEQLTLLKKL